jgi:hypothetical protein
LGLEFGPSFCSDRVEPQGPVMLRYTRYRGTDMRWRFSDSRGDGVFGPRRREDKDSMVRGRGFAYRLLNEDPISLTADILRACDDQRSRPS